MRDERRAGLLADSLEDVEHPGRELACDEVTEERARERRPFGRFENDGAARGEPGRRLPCREHEWRVPRRDHRGGPDGIRWTRFQVLFECQSRSS